MWPKYYGIIYHVTDTSCDLESVNPNKFFLLVLRLSSNGQAQTWKAVNINVMFSIDIKLMNFPLAVLTLLRNITLPEVNHDTK